MATFGGASNQLDIHVQTVFIGASSNASWDKANNRFSGTITEINVTANNTTDETCYPLFADGATGSQGAESDTGLTYNPSTGLLTSTGFSGVGTSLTALNATNLGSGTVPTARLGSGTASSSNFLRGDGSWSSVSISSDSNENTILGTTNASGGNSNDNVVIGYQAGHGLWAGHENILVGYQSGYNISGGDRNTVLGYKALYDNNVDNVIAIGYKCGEGLSGNYNILIGDNVCESSNQSGSTNVSIGSYNLRYGSGWQYNTLVGGNNFGASNSAADYCVALGYGALYSSTTGNYNTASGYYALNDATTGYENSASGAKALEFLTTGYRNTAIGYQAGAYSTNLTTGYYNILLGYRAQPSSSTVYGEVTIGDSNINKFRVPGINFVLKDNWSVPGAGKVLTTDSNGEGYWADGGTSSDSHYNTVGGTTNFSSNSNATKNTVFGYQAGHSINGSTGSGDDNTIIGYRAMASSDKGFNTAVGIQAMESSSGQYVTAIGRMAGQNYHGSSSIFIGSGAGARGTTSSYYNVVIGNNAFYEAYNWPGQRNVALGESVGYRNAGASDSTIVGHYTLFNATTATQNTTLGSETLRSLTTGTGNIAIGYRAGYSGGSNALTTGGNNIIIGKDAKATSATVSNEITFGNTSINKFRVPGVNFVVRNSSATNGYVLTADSNGEAHWATGGTGTGEHYVYTKHNNGSLSSSGENTYAGAYAGNSLSSGNYKNTFFGFYAGSSANASGGNSCDNNTFFGANAGETCTRSNNTLIGAAINSVTTGGDNTCVGYSSGGDISTSYSNTTVGSQAGSNVTTGGGNTLIGAYSGKTHAPSGNITTQSNIICLGDNNATDLYCADTSISSSDKRDKTDITDFTHGLKWIEQLKPVTYKWDKRSWYSDDLSATPDGSKKRARQHIGFLAQDVLAIEQADGYASKKDDMLVVNLNEDDTAYGLKYERLVPVLVNAIKELSAKVAALEAA